ncbi:MAG: GNAT family N-acetyltransferase [Bacteroidetes bacterium]|nr:GNAT family N-acetyltransferase [Bacteroidota bacterium]
MNYNFRKAELTEVPQIWTIIQQAIVRRKNDGSKQWQDGYPNEEIIKSDIKKGFAYILTGNDEIIGYAAVIFNDEPAYNAIEGSWLSNEEFIVIHRIAISDKQTGKGLAKLIMSFTEDIALKNNIFSVKVDTNFDNIAMLKTFERSGYTYCGEVMLWDGLRKAYEKKLFKV